MSMLQTQFKAATRILQGGSVDKATEQQRWRMYGLSKQATEGDCSIPSPPATDVKKKWKWEAWNACKGLKSEDAMLAFIKEVEKLDPSFKSASITNNAPPATTTLSPQKSNRTASSHSAAVTFEGILYKQRDVFKGWRPRHFKLQDVFLHYYLEKDDINPRKSMELTGCSVDIIKPTKVGDVEYFPLIISHPKSTKSYNLATLAKADCDAWVAAISQAASRPAVLVNEAESPTVRVLPRRPHASTAKDDDSEVTTNSNDTNKGSLVNAQATLQDIPAKYAIKMESAVETLLTLTKTTEGWDQLFEKKGLYGYRKSGTSGSSVCVRGDLLIPYSIVDIFPVIYSNEKAQVRDPQVHTAQVIKSYSSHTHVQYLRYKQIWPTAIRDFCNLNHWRLLVDGTVIFVAFSEKFDDICPLIENHVRGEVVIAGYVLKPVSGGTQCTYMVQSDLKGSIPTSIVSMVSSNQPMVLLHIKKHLETSHAAVVKSGAIFSGIKKYTYEDFQAKLGITSTGNSSSSNESNPAVGGSSGAAASNLNLNSNNTSLPSSSNQPLNSVTSNDIEVINNRMNRNKKQTSNHSYILFFPLLLYYIASPHYRAVGFIFGLIVAVRFLLKKHMGDPKVISSGNNMEQVASGRMVIRFPVDLSKLLRFLETNREETGVDVTFTHLAIKAAAVAMYDTPTLNGHMLYGSFYKSKTPGIDVSVSVESPSKDTVMIKIVDAEIKPSDYIADEMRTRTKNLRDTSSTSSVSTRAKILNMFPFFLKIEINKFFNFIGSGLGIEVPLLGITAYPLGVCSVITLPGGDTDVDISVFPDMSDSTAPVTVAIGGIRVQPSFDSDKKITAAPVLNISVTIDCQAGSLADGRKYCARLQQYMNNPSLLNKFDRKYAATYEDEKILSDKNKK